MIQNEQPHIVQVGGAALAGAHSPVMSAPKPVAECLIRPTRTPQACGKHDLGPPAQREHQLGVKPFTYDHTAAAQWPFLQYSKVHHTTEFNYVTSGTIKLCG